jgi:predicted DNA-binding transcriptional regulator AlpA
VISSRPVARPPVEPAYYTVSDLQARLKVSRATISRWAGSGRLPAPLHIGERTPRWPVATIQTWEALGLIRFFGHQPKGEYGVQHGPGVEASEADISALA